MVSFLEGSHSTGSGAFLILPFYCSILSVPQYLCTASGWRHCNQRWPELQNGLDDWGTRDFTFDAIGEERLKDEPLLTNFTPQMNGRPHAPVAPKWMYFL